MYRNETEAAQHRVAQLEDRIEALSALQHTPALGALQPTATRRRPSTLRALGVPLVALGLATAGVAALTIYWLGIPKGQTVMRSNAGHSVSVLFRTDVTDVAFENEDRSQKLPPLSVGFSNIHAAQLPLPGAAHNGEATPSRVATVILPPSQINANGATKLHVRYRVFGIPREADITFVAGTEDSRFARNVLESMPSSWVAFSKPGTRSLVYFTMMLAYKYAIREIRYGFDDAPLSERVHFQESNVANIDPTDEIYLPAPAAATQIRVQIVFKDGVETEVRTILRSDATLP